MARRYFSSTAQRTTLSAGLTAIDTIITVGAVTGFPGTKPYTLIIDEGTASEEVVEVTGGSGTSLVVTRGVDGTAATTHSAGASVVHGFTARDLDEPNAHIEKTNTVHGVAGDVVGTTDTQTLTNKTISGASNTLSNIPQSAVTNLVADLAAKAVYPTQAGNAGKVLMTNGTAVAWADGTPGPTGPQGPPGTDAVVNYQPSAPSSPTTGELWIDSDDAIADATIIPSQTGNTGKYLSTDGSNMTWEELVIPPAATGESFHPFLMGL